MPNALASGIESLVRLLCRRIDVEAKKFNVGFLQSLFSLIQPFLSRFSGLVDSLVAITAEDSSRSFNSIEMLTTQK